MGFTRGGTTQKGKRQMSENGSLAPVQTSCKHHRGQAGRALSRHKPRGACAVLLEGPGGELLPEQRGCRGPSGHPASPQGSLSGDPGKTGPPKGPLLCINGPACLCTCRAYVLRMTRRL